MSVPLQLRTIDTLLQQGQQQQALTNARQLAADITARSDSSVSWLGQLALQLSTLQQFSDAATLYQRAIALKADDATLHYNYATMLRVCGELKQAEQQLDIAIKLNPDDAEAWQLRSGLGKQTAVSNHVNELKQQLSRSDLSAKARVHLQYALAKELEDLADYQASFAALKHGADLRRRHINYDIQQDVAVMQSIVANFNRPFFARPASGCDTDEPIFVVSLPRAGSTLLERFLGSSEQVHLAGELNNFARCLQQQLQQQFPGWRPASKVAMVEQSRQLDFAQLGQRYLDSTRPHTGQSRYFVDKLPLNFLYVGLIHRALPNARIIHVKRQPLDHCYAMYKHLFADAYPFSYQLSELAQYYHAYQQLMQHWQQVLPGVIHDVRYEELVTTPEPCVQALYQHCRLPWSADYLAFHQQNRQASATGSASQIRQPLYRSSVERWRCYEKELDPLQHALQGLAL
tara:strand:- start:10391 stop:11770 length:1380 start_codon:yes stop_codon:yes gene_type:complete